MRKGDNRYYGRSTERHSGEEQTFGSLTEKTSLKLSWRQ